MGHLENSLLLAPSWERELRQVWRVSIHIGRVALDHPMKLALIQQYEND
jgi:hypothetical protein